MKAIMKMRHFILVIIIGTMPLCLISCGGKNKNLRADGSFPQYIGNGAEDHMDRVPSEAAAVDDLPEMSSDDFERLGDVHFKRGDLYMAYAQYQKSLRFDPENTRVYYKIGILQVIGGMNKEAIKSFKEVLERESRHALAYMGIGQACFQMQDYDRAEKQFRKALELDAKLWKSHNFLGIIYDYRKQHEKAIQEYLAAIDLQPDNGSLYNNLGLAYSFTGEYSQAVAAFNNALETKNAPESKVYNNLGLTLAKAGRYQESLDAFRKGGDEAQAYNNLGCIYLLQGEKERAKWAFEKALETKPAFYTKASENLRKSRVAPAH